MTTVMVVFEGAWMLVVGVGETVAADGTVVAADETVVAAEMVAPDGRVAVGGTVAAWMLALELP